MEYGPLLVWLAALQALALAGAPLAAVLFPRFPDRGAALALPTGLVVWTVTTYWIGHLAFGRIAAVAGLIALLAASALALRGASFRWRRHLEATLVFAAAFLFAVGLRAVDPSVNPTTGEMFLDFGLLQSLLRADSLPPEDVWFAGRPVQYYYGAHLLAAMLADLLGTPARYAFNLAIAGFYATLVTTAYGVAGALADARGASARAGGALGAFLVGFASNLFTPARLLVNVLPGSAARRLATVLDTRADILATETFWYQNSAWIIPAANTEFPLLTYVNGNLRPQMVSPTFLLVLVALLFAYYRTAAGRVRRRRLLLVAAAPVVGVLVVVDTWTVPTAGGLVALALYFAPGRPTALVGLAPRTDDARGGDGNRIRAELRRAAAALTGGVAVVVAGAATVAPFFLETATTRPLAFGPTPAGMGQLVLVYGSYLLVFALYLFSRLRGRRLPVRAGTLLFAGWAFVVLAWTLEFAVAVAVGPLLAVAAALARRRADVGYETVLVVAGAGLVGLIELAFVADQAGPGRFNTVVKVSMQVWVLWGVAAGAVLAALLRDGAGIVPRRLAAPVGGRRLRAALLASLVLTLSLFGGLAVADHVDGGSDEPLHRVDDPTLDALAFVETRHPGVAPAIAWLGDRPGQPRLVSAPTTEIYQWANAPSALTGLPTVAGWSHAADYHGKAAYLRRVADVATIFEGPAAERRRLLRTYGVDFIYVGPRERARYDTRDYADEPGITVAFRSERATVYAVNASAFPG